MNFIQSIILGIVQGLSEFLPISSSGHLAVTQYFFGIKEDDVLVFTVMLHFGTLISIFVVYRKDIMDLLRELVELFKDVKAGRGVQPYKNETRKLGIMIIAATIPTGIIGLLFNDLFNSLYSNLLFIGCGLLITGTCLFAAERWGGGEAGVKEMKLRHAIFIGFCQALAICPGISRSGSTMVGGLASKFNRPHAVRFAFLISIPSVLGAFILELPKAFEAVSAGSGTSPLTLIVGIAVAAVSGYIAIKMMINAVIKEKLFYFAIYTWIVGLMLIVYSMFA